MKKHLKVLIVSCACLFASSTGQISTEAAINLETDAPVAGVSVALNNYYASSLSPEDELAAAFSSQGALEQAVKSARDTEAPVVKEPRSAYENIAISKVSNYVNVRAQANTGSAVVGKIYNNCAATILQTVDGEGGKWYQIQSGSVKGYIKAQYFITGAEAEKAARQVGRTFGTVSTTTQLRLREKPDLNSATLELLSPKAEYEVIGEEGDFLKISVDTDLVGYVFKDYINMRVDFDKAVSLEEEKAREAEAARLKKEAEDAIKKMEDAKKEAAQKQQTTKAPETVKAPETAKAPETTKAPQTVKAPNSNYTDTIEANPGGAASQPTKAPETKAPETTKAPTKAPTKAETTIQAPGAEGPGNGPGGASGEVTSATRSAVVAYAKQFLGNPYVYGGTSLTNGADCSGFTQGVFAHFGITTGRSSRDQAAKGREISVSNAQPGDLLFYASGNYINHVAIYIGGGQIIHSSTPATGITTAPANYRTPCKAVSFLD